MKLLLSCQFQLQMAFHRRSPTTERIFRRNLSSPQLSLASLKYPLCCVGKILEWPEKWFFVRLSARSVVSKDRIGAGSDGGLRGPKWNFGWICRSRSYRTPSDSTVAQHRQEAQLRRFLLCEELGMRLPPTVSRLGSSFGLLIATYQFICFFIISSFLHACPCERLLSVSLPIKLSLVLCVWLAAMRAWRSDESNTSVMLF